MLTSFRAIHICTIINSSNFEIVKIDNCPRTKLCYVEMIILKLLKVDVNCSGADFKLVHGGAWGAKIMIKNVDKKY